MERLQQTVVLTYTQQKNLWDFQWGFCGGFTHMGYTGAWVGLLIQKGFNNIHNRKILPKVYLLKLGNHMWCDIINRKSHRV